MLFRFRVDKLRLVDQFRRAVGARKKLDGLEHGQYFQFCLGVAEKQVGDPLGIYPQADINARAVKRSYELLQIGEAEQIVKAVGRIEIERDRLLDADQRDVDGVGKIISREPSENWEWVRVSVPADLMKYVVLKGSITIDGVSLTVNEVGADFVGLSLIPETLRLTTLGSKQPGDIVNLEADVMAKHIERLLEARFAGQDFSKKDNK